MSTDIIMIDELYTYTVIVADYTLDRECITCQEYNVGGRIITLCIDDSKLHVRVWKSPTVAIHTY